MQYLALLTTKVFIPCVWTFGCCKQPASTKRQHYGVAEEKAVQLLVVISFSPNYLRRVRKHKDDKLQHNYTHTHTTK